MQATEVPPGKHSSITHIRHLPPIGCECIRSMIERTASIPRSSAELLST